MPKKRKPVEAIIIERPERMKLSEEECLKRMREFPKRKAKFIASIRKSKSRNVSA